MASVPGSTVPVEPVHPPPPPEVQDPNAPKPEVYGPPAPGTPGANPVDKPGPSCPADYPHTNPADISAANHPPETLKDWKSPPNDVSIQPTNSSNGAAPKNTVTPGYELTVNADLGNPKPQSPLGWLTGGIIELAEPENVQARMVARREFGLEVNSDGRTMTLPNTQEGGAAYSDIQYGMAGFKGQNITARGPLPLPEGMSPEFRAGYEERSRQNAINQVITVVSTIADTMPIGAMGRNRGGGFDSPLPRTETTTTGGGKFNRSHLDTPQRLEPSRNLDAPNSNTGGKLLRPTPPDAIRSSLTWLSDQPNTAGAPKDLVDAGNKLNQLLGGRSPTSLTDQQTTELYRDLNSSPEGAKLSKNQTFMEHLSGRFSSPITGNSATALQQQFTGVRQTLADGGVSDAKNRALARVDVQVNGTVAGRQSGYSDTFFATSGKNISSQRYSTDIHSTKTIDRIISPTQRLPDGTVIPRVRETTHDPQNLHPVYPSSKNQRVFEAEAAAIQQTQRTLNQLEQNGQLKRNADGTVDARGVSINIALDRISCPSCGAGVPEWLNQIRAEYRNIDINVQYLP
jgi:hypothetical protein